MIQKSEYISFTNSEEILDKFPQDMRDEAEVKGFAARPVMGKELVFLVIQATTAGLAAYWMPFDVFVSEKTGELEQVTDEEFDQFFSLIDYRGGTDIWHDLMQKAFTWIARSKHPQFPDNLDMPENAWRIYDIGWKMKYFYPQTA